jgi:hypothetical protein
MGDWYTIGLALGLGTSLGVLFAGLLTATPLGRAAAVVVSGALRRGGTRGGLALIVTGIAIGLAGLSFVPLAGYVVALAVPVLALRLRRTQSERYAGLRTLAKD